MSNIVSKSTLRPQDLIPKFLDELRKRDEVIYSQFVLDRCFPAHAAEDDDAEWWDSEDCIGFLNDLIEALNDCSPPGYWFGTHEGDGALWGFWREDI